MNDYSAYRRMAIRYWERRRAVYNAALVVPTALGYGCTVAVNHVGDVPATPWLLACTLLRVSALGANAVYSLGYALEFLFGSDAPDSRWLRVWRSFTFGAGTLLSMLLALLGGSNIGMMEWQHYVRH
jgi:hypothetical protein